MWPGGVAYSSGKEILKRERCHCQGMAKCDRESDIAEHFAHGFVMHLLGRVGRILLSSIGHSSATAVSINGHKDFAMAACLYVKYMEPLSM